MYLRRFTDFILRSRLHAIGIAFAIALIPLVGSSFSILIAALVALRKDTLTSGLVFLAATLPFVIRYFAFPDTANVELTIGMVSVAIAANLLTWLYAVFLRQHGSWTSIIEVTLLIGVIVVGMAHFIFPNLLDWWAKALTTYFSKTLSMIGVEDHGAPSQEALALMISSMKYYATGFVVMFVLLNVVLQLLMARWWEVVIFNPGGLKIELQQIRLSQVIGFLFLAMLTLSYFNNPLAMDTMPMFYAMFFLAGLSVIHYLIQRKVPKGGWVWILLLYAVVIGLLPLSVLIVVSIAFFDTWLDIRKRVNNKLT